MMEPFNQQAVYSFKTYLLFISQSNVLTMLTQGAFFRLFQQILCAILFYTFSQSIIAGSLINYGITHLIGSNQSTARQFNQRFGFNADYYHEDLISSPQFSVEAVNGVSLLSDWYPGKGDFRLSAGVLYQPGNAANVSYGLSWSQLNSTSGFARVNEDGLTSYFGLGWGNNIKQYSQIDYNLDMGILYQPDSRVLGQSAYSENTTRDRGDQLESLAISPVVSFGVSYSF